MTKTVNTKTVEEQFEQAAKGARKDQSDQEAIEKVNAILTGVEKAKKSGVIPPTLLQELYAALAEVRDPTAQALKIGEAGKVLRGIFPKAMLVAAVEKFRLECRRVWAEKKSEEETALRKAEINTSGIKILSPEEARVTMTVEAALKGITFEDESEEDRATRIKMMSAPNEVITDEGKKKVKLYDYNTLYDRNFPFTRKELAGLELGDPTFASPLLGQDTRIRLAPAIEFLNARLAYIRNPGLVVSLWSGDTFVAEKFWEQSEAEFVLMRPSDFSSHHYANFYYFDPADDLTPIKKLAPAWLVSPHRRQIERMTYHPGKPIVIIGSELNRWTGWACESIEGDVSLWHWLMGFMFPDPEDRLFVERWIALPIQFPGTKMFTALVIISDVQGVGKTIVGEILSRIYGINAIFINKKTLEGAFNEWAKDKQIVFAEEITGGERDTTEEIKQMITQEEILINEKHLPRYRIPDVANWMFFSNQSDALFINDQDRRFAVFDIQRTKEETLLVKPMHEQVAEWGKRSPHGPAALRYYFEHLDLGDFKATDRAPQNEAKRSMSDEQKSSLQHWVEDQAELGGADGWLNQGKHQVLWELSELIKYWNPDGRKKERETAMISHIKRAGYVAAGGEKKDNRVPTKHARRRLWIMVPKPNRFQKMSPEELGKLFDREHGLDKIDINEGSNIPF